jgi:fucose permease
MHGSSHQDLITIGLAYLGFMSLGIYAGLLGLAWPSMQAEFQVSLADQGALLLAATVGSLFASFYSGSLTYRFGVGRMLMIGSAAITVSLFIVALTQSWLIFIITMLVIGLGAGAIDAALNTYAAQHFSERVMNWLHACFGIGITITPLIMTAIFSAKLSWRIGYVVAGIILAIVTVLYLVTQSRWRSTVVPQGDSKAPVRRRTMGETLRLPIVWIGIGLLFLCAGLETTPGNWMFTLFTEGRGIAEVEAAQWVGVYWGSFTVGRLFFGAIISRVNTTKLLNIVMFGALVGAAMLWWNAAPWIGFAGLTLLGFSQAPVYPVLTSATPRRVGSEHAANAVGFQVAGASAGLALVPAFAGVLAESISLEVIPPIVFASVVIMFVLYQLVLAQSGRIASVNPSTAET